MTKDIALKGYRHVHVASCGLPFYGCGSKKYYYMKDNEVARRTCGSAIYVY